MHAVGKKAPGGKWGIKAVCDPYVSLSCHSACRPLPPEAFLAQMELTNASPSLPPSSPPIVSQQPPSPPVPPFAILILNFTLTPKRVANAANDVWLAKLRSFIAANVAKAIKVRCVCLHCHHSHLLVHIIRHPACSIHDPAVCTARHHSNGLLWHMLSASLRASAAP